MTRATARRHSFAGGIHLIGSSRPRCLRSACLRALAAGFAMTAFFAPAARAQDAAQVHTPPSLSSMLAPGATPQPGAAQLHTATAYTSPSEKRILNFTTPGFVAEMPVKEGDVVKENQMLMRLDDEADVLERDRLKLDAESNARVEFAKAELDQNQVKLKRAQTIFAGGGGNASEVEDAQLAVIQSEKSLVLAEDQVKQAKIKLLIQEKHVKDMRILSPIDGIVAKVNIGVGELGEQAKQDGAIVVVKNDPLDVDLKELTTWQAAKLEVGQKLQVRYADDHNENEWADATIASFAPVADAASETRAIKLKLPNKDGRASGLKLIVKLPDMLVETTSTEAESAAAK